MEAKAILNLYEIRGFTISRLEGDREFACITNDILPAVLNVADADETMSTKSKGSRSAYVAPSKDYHSAEYHVL